MNIKDSILNYYNKLDNINKILVNTIIILIIIIVLWSIIWIIMIRVNPTTDNDYFKKVKSLTLYDKSKNGEIFNVITNKILNRLSNNNYTFSIWLYIDDIYRQKNKQWKHILHMGTTVKKTSKPVKLEWNTLEHQNPGLWLFPNQNKLRLVVSTNISIPKLKYKKIKLEYIDIPNIEIKEWFNLIVVINYRIVEIYLNGYLLITKILTSEPITTNKKLYINYNKGFIGKIKNLEFISKNINNRIANRIYNLGKTITYNLPYFSFS